MGKRLDQREIANEMRRAAQLAREHGHPEIADGNEQIAEYIEGLESGLAAERALSARRTKLADSWCDEAARRDARIEELEEGIEAALKACPYAIRVREGGGPENLAASLAVTFSKMQHRIAELEATTIGNIQDFASDMQAQDREVIAALEKHIVELEKHIVELETERNAREAQLAEMRLAIANAANGTDSAHRRIARILSMLDEFAIPTDPPEAEEDDA